MRYQVSLEGHLHGNHVQLNYHDVRNYSQAIQEAKDRKHLPVDALEEYVSLLFMNKERAIKDGIPSDQIEKLSPRLYRYKIPD